MIEKVTESLIAQWRKTAHPATSPDVAYWRDMARAAIEAMREPTFDMMQALDDGDEYQGLEYGWTAAIDAALGLPRFP
jgi:hypothetical protein